MVPRTTFHFPEDDDDFERIKKFLPDVEKVARLEFRWIPPGLINFETLVEIAVRALHALTSKKSSAEIDRLERSYIQIAMRWAIRNELRTRYKWYTLKHTGQMEEDVEEEKSDSKESEDSLSAERIREAIYKTILSIEGTSESGDTDIPHAFIKDSSIKPDDRLEISELGQAIKRAIENLPPKERSIIEYRLYKNMSAEDIASMIGLSRSRITRIVQAALNRIRDSIKEAGCSESLQEPVLDLVGKVQQILEGYFILKETVQSLAQATNLPEPFVQQVVHLGQTFLDSLE